MDDEWKTDLYGLWILSKKGFFTRILGRTMAGSMAPVYGKYENIYVQDLTGNIYMSNASLAGGWGYLQFLLPDLKINFPFFLKLYKSESETPEYYYVADIRKESEEKDVPEGSFSFSSDHFSTPVNNAWKLAPVQTVETITDEEVKRTIRSASKVDENTFVTEGGFPVLGNLVADDTTADLHVFDMDQPEGSQDLGPYNNKV